MGLSFTKLRIRLRNARSAWWQRQSFRWAFAGGCLVVVFGVFWGYRVSQRPQLEDAEHRMAVVEDLQSLHLSPLPDDAVALQENQQAVAGFLPEWGGEWEEPPVHALHEEVSQGPRLLPNGNAHSIDRAGFEPESQRRSHHAAWLKGTIEAVP